jgi:type IV fimbrial biogenesis protein FimT
VIAKGFTLLEIIVTIAIVSILLLIAIPFGQSIVAYINAEVITYRLRNIINYANYFALQHGKVVTLCPSKDGVNCQGTWNDGLLLLADSPLRYYPGTNSGTLTLKSFADNSKIQFYPQKLFQQNGTFYYHSENHSRSIIINKVGRIRIATSQ